MNKMAVIGAGTMGNGIAQVFAQAGWQVTLIDVQVEQLQKALQTIEKNLDRMIAKGTLPASLKQETLDRLKTNTVIAIGVQEAEIVVEAATENKKIKLAIFKEIDQYAPDSCILASNTSSIPIQEIADATQRPQQVIGMHFMNPVPVMKLVEIIKSPVTLQSVTEKTVELSKALGKIPCIVNDFPGFISNRILMPMLNEAICSLEEGVAGVEEIDNIMKLGMAHPMGPLQLADLIGLDVCLSIMQVLELGFNNPKYKAAKLLETLVSEGKLGVKSGEGFYQYRSGSKELIVSSRFSS
ncbi:MAG: 3-hydroxybutyryl-CoA dehydrogenase [Bacteroidetes bacterium]|nr:3-hydroxybutyryl-CoA dehydrogenase [Bacteroidota bacterium]